MRIFRKIHLWLSVPFGVIITLICFSGAMLVFEPEITRGLKGDIYYVTSAEGEPIDMKELMETVKATLPDSVSITGVTVFDDKDRTYQVSLSKPRRASLFIDQYSGKITGKYERIGFFSAMFRLHRWLLDSGNPHGGGLKVGKLLVGVSTLVFVIALVTGVVVWYPRAKRNLAHSLSISFKDGWRGLWKGFHVAGGMYALILLLAMSLTGLTWSFNWYRTFSMPFVEWNILPGISISRKKTIIKINRRGALMTVSDEEMTVIIVTEEISVNIAVRATGVQSSAVGSRYIMS